jgi:hypothetical protein
MMVKNNFKNLDLFIVQSSIWLATNEVCGSCFGGRLILPAPIVDYCTQNNLPKRDG